MFTDTEVFDRKVVSIQWGQEKKGYVSDLARQSTLRGHGMSNFLVRISTVMSLLDSPVEIRENSIRKRSFANSPQNWKIISDKEYPIYIRTCKRSSGLIHDSVCSELE